MTTYQPTLDFARQLDEQDPLRGYRERFFIPRARTGAEAIYFCGNSLGLQPVRAREYAGQEFDDWAHLAVDAHFEGKTPWYSYHEVFRDMAARLVGAKPDEVVVMNSLTTNLHLMMVSFYRPEGRRCKLVIEDGAFPSDTYAVKSQVAYHGYTPEQGLILVRPREGEYTIRTEDLLELIEREGAHIALFMMSGVNYRTGQWYDMPRITAAAQAKGCLVGWDLAHAAGNVPLHLHDWGVDFAAWCSYKYLNSGPGAVAGCFVHERHGSNSSLPRFAGWWGNDPKTRFRMHLEPDFKPILGADGWQLSNPPIFALAPMRASYELFDEAGMEALRQKSLLLTGYLEFLIDRAPRDWFDLITPRDPAARGAQLSILVHDRPKERFAALLEAGVVCDFRPPDVIRVAPVPLYNRFEEVLRFAEILSAQPG